MAGFDDTIKLFLSKLDVVVSNCYKRRVLILIDRLMYCTYYYNVYHITINEEISLQSNNDNLILFK